MGFDRYPPESAVLEYFDRYSNWGRWSDADERGTLNFITADTRVEAARLVTDGAVVSCAKLLSTQNHIGSPPLHGPPQHFMVQCGAQYAGRENQPGVLQSAKDYFGLVFHNLSVTHLDAVSHVYWNGLAYNGRSADTCTADAGCTFGSVDVAHAGIVSRGVLLDIPRARGDEWVAWDDPITIDDLVRAEARAGLRVASGDILIVRTGIGRRLASQPEWDPLREGVPGMSPDCLAFLYEREVAVLACDTGSDCLPSPYELTHVPIHQVGLVAMGLWLLDNCALEDLSEACAQRSRWEFLFNIAPLRIEFGSGSPVNPIAMF